MVDLETIEISVETKLHLLRHFEGISSECRDELVAGGCAEADIDHELAIPGSKFFREFATSPDQAIAEILENALAPVWENNRSEISALFSKSAYPAGIGITNIVPVSELSAEEIKGLEKRPRSGNPYLVNFVKSARKELTWQGNLILGNRKGCVEILTMFPGEIAPPIPDESRHTPEEYDQFDNFWRNHAFLISTEESYG